MAFVGEKIVNESDKQYVASKGFTYIAGEVIERARYWAVDRERNMIFVSRGGGGLEMPKGYSLLIDGIIVDMEGHEYSEGNRYDNNLKIYWIIERISVPKAWFVNCCNTERLKQIIKEAVTAYSCIGLKPSQVQEVTVEINAEPRQKYNDHGEPV